MLQIIVVFFGPFYLFKIKLSSSYRFIALILGFSINYSAYFAEIFRSGIQSVEKGQIEAAKLLGLTGAQINLKIVMPQVIKRTLPSIGNEIITLIKDTSLVYALGITEIFKIAKSISTRDVTLTPYIVVGVIYLILTAVITKLLNRAEKKVYYEE